MCSIWQIDEKTNKTVHLLHFLRKIQKDLDSGSAYIDTSAGVGSAAETGVAAPSTWTVTWQLS